MNKTILEYRDGATALRGVLLTPEVTSGRYPDVVLFPDARGIGTHSVACAERLAALGLVVLVTDLYGEGKTAPDVPQAIELMNALVSLTQLANFERDMRQASVDWQVHVYGGAAHGFTNPELIGAGLPDLAYHEAADRRSWSAMLDLFEDTFAVTLR